MSLKAIMTEFAQTLPAPYRVIKVTRPLSLSGLTTDGSVCQQMYVEMFAPRPLTVQQSNQLLTPHGGPYFDPDWISNPTEVLYMCTINLTCSVTDPEKVS